MTVLLLSACVFKASPPDSSPPGPSSPSTATAGSGVAPAQPRRAMPSGRSAESSLSTAPPTTVIDYAPERPAGNARQGSCWTNSLTVSSRIAWRCSAGNLILDPCFPLAQGEVVCNPNPLTGEAGILVKLSEPLPRPDLIVENSSSAWLLELGDQTVCALATGATGVIDGKRINYVCAARGAKTSEQVVILGNPQPGKVWTAERATTAIRDGKLIATTSAVVPLRAVVRGPGAYVPYSCGPVADSLAALLGTEVQRTEVPLTDPVSGDWGTACQVVAADVGAGLLYQPADLVRRMLTSQAWQEDTRYRTSDALRSTSAYRKGDALCLLETTKSASSPGAVATGPGSGSQPDSEKQLYTIALRCARDRSTSNAQSFGLRPPEEINFQPDTTADSLNRPIAAGEVQEYALRASAGQTMIVKLASASKDVFLTISGRDDGAVLLRPSANARRWQGRLPTNEEYVLRVANRGDATQVSLRIVIPVTLTLPTEGRPIAVRGTAAADHSMYYLVSGLAGQTLAAGFSSADPSLFLAVSGLEDEQSLVSGASRTRSWTGRLTRSQDYLIEVASDSSSAAYTVELSVQGP